MTAIKAEKLCLSYDGHNVVSDLDFEVSEGDYLCVVGENGSGKSTLIKALLGLKKVSSGILKMSKNSKPPYVGYLPQQTDTQKDFPASAYEVVLSGCLGGKRLFSFYTKNDKKRAEENMKRVGVVHIKDECYRNLSGGQQQRVLLARALCAAKNILILDEPVTGLDPSSSEEMYETLERLNKEMGMTIVMVSHDMEATLKYSSHILHLDNSVLFFGKTDDYIEQRKVSKGDYDA